MYIKTYIKILSKSSEYKRVVIKYVVYMCVCMYECVYMYMYVCMRYMYMNKLKNISAYMCAWKQTSMYVHKYVCVLYIYLFIRKNIFLIDREK